MKADRAGLTEEMKAGGIETRGEDWGELRVRHIELPPGVDFTPFFEGLPGDLCQCPHWGYVLDGSITLRYADGSQETTRTGEMYYWRGGHTGWTDEGVSFIEISPAAEIREVMEHLAAKMAASAG